MNKTLTPSILFKSWPFSADSQKKISPSPLAFSNASASSFKPILRRYLAARTGWGSVTCQAWLLVDVVSNDSRIKKRSCHIENKQTTRLPKHQEKPKQTKGFWSWKKKKKWINNCPQPLDITGSFVKTTKPPTPATLSKQTANRWLRLTSSTSSSILAITGPLVACCFNLARSSRV